MAKVTESRRVQVQNRVVTLADVRRLAGIVDSCHRHAETLGKDAKVKFSVACEDQSQFVGEDSDMFDDGSVIESKRVSSIEMQYYSFELGQELSISLHHGGGDYRNYVAISGKDSIWVNGTLRSVEDVVLAMPPQSQIVAKNRAVWEFVFAMGLGSLYHFAMGLLLVSLTSGPPSKVIVELADALRGFEVHLLLTKYVSAYLFGMVPAYWLVGKLEKLWPIVEVQLGPEHMQVEKRRRTWLGGAVMAGVVPLVTSVVYDLLKLMATATG